MDSHSSRISTSHPSSPQSSKSVPKSRRTYLPGQLDLQAHKPNFSARPALQSLTNQDLSQRQDTSPGKETRLVHFPPHSWTAYWTRGTKSDYECRR